MIKASPFAKKIETPVSVRIIGIDEIEKNPGDVQNVYKFKAEQPPILIRETDNNKLPVTDPTDPLRYSLKYIKNMSGTVPSTIGVIIEF